MKNNSTRSVILCPFNTQANGDRSMFAECDNLMEEKDFILRFNVRVREMDRQYEKFNNQDFDNGVYHKYAYNQGKNKDGTDQDNPLQEEEIKQSDVEMHNLVGKGQKRAAEDFMNYYIRINEKIIDRVGLFGFPEKYIRKCIEENLNNHCTSSYYLLCMDQNY
jgi:hypothetical protein